MKALSFVPVLFLLLCDASAQVASDLAEAPGIVVTRIGWHKETYNPALYEDPMLVHEDRSELVREQIATVRGNVVRIQQGEPAKPLPTPKPSRESTAFGISVNYRYQAKIKNIGKKTIRENVWLYLLFDPETEVELGRHRYTSRVDVHPGKMADLIGRSTKSPTAVVDASKTDKEWMGKYSERVVIDRIEYNDGTFWQRTAK